MYSDDERLAAVLEISRVERIVHGLRDNDPKAIDDAREMIEQIANLENGLMFIISGIGAMLTYVEKNGNVKGEVNDE